MCRWLRKPPDCMRHARRTLSNQATLRVVLPGAPKHVRDASRFTAGRPPRSKCRAEASTRHQRKAQQGRKSHIVGSSRHAGAFDRANANTIARTHSGTLHRNGPWRWANLRTNTTTSMPAHPNHTRAQHAEESHNRSTQPHNGRRCRPCCPPGARNTGSSCTRKCAHAHSMAM